MNLKRSRAMRIEGISSQTKMNISNLEEHKVKNREQTQKLELKDLSKLKDLTQSLNQYLEAQEIPLKFRVQNEQKVVQVNLIDTKENKVIQKIPPDEVLNIARHIEDTIGVFVRKSF